MLDALLPAETWPPVALCLEFVLLDGALYVTLPAKAIMMQIRRSIEP